MLLCVTHSWLVPSSLVLVNVNPFTMMTTVLYLNCSCKPIFIISNNAGDENWVNVRQISKLLMDIRVLLFLVKYYEPESQGNKHSNHEQIHLTNFSHVIKFLDTKTDQLIQTLRVKIEVYKSKIWEL